MGAFLKSWIIVNLVQDHDGDIDNDQEENMVTIKATVQCGVHVES